MPPKKKVEEEKKVKLGRPGNTLKMGIVGLPNVGKSTTFNCLSKLNVAAENYPFCTIEPNLAQVPVPDERFDHLVKTFNPKSKVHAVLRIQDIAGLVPGAHKGEGLGNAFLSHIRDCDGIYQVVRAFDDPEVVHTEMEVDPVRDMQIIYEELLLKDKETVDKKFEEATHKLSRQGQDKQAKEDLEILTKLKDHIDNKRWIISENWVNIKEIEFINNLLLLTAKPIVYLVNLSEKDYLRKKNKWLPKIKEWADNNLPGLMIPYSAEHEKNLLQAQIQAQEETKEDVPVAETSCLPKIIKNGYKTLDLIYFFTSGPDEVRAWTIRQGCKAPQAAGVIHTDFERGFICAEVMKYEDFLQCGGETQCKEAGKYLQKGKEYEVLDGDIIFFKFNVGSQPKKK